MHVRTFPTELDNQLREQTVTTALALSKCRECFFTKLAIQYFLFSWDLQKTTEKLQYDV